MTREMILISIWDDNPYVIAPKKKAAYVNKEFMSPQELLKYKEEQEELARKAELPPDIPPADRSRLNLIFEMHTALSCGRYIKNRANGASFC